MKARSDSWYSTLDEQALWKLYALARRGAAWFEVVKVAQDEFGLADKVSRSGYYRWLDWMRGEESERRLAQARIAALEVDDLAKSVGLVDEKAIKAYKSLAAEIALKGDAKTASKFLGMAMSLRDRQLHERDLDFKAQDLARKDEELKIAQKKLAILEQKEQDARGVVADAKLTPEEREAKLKKIFGI